MAANGGGQPAHGRHRSRQSRASMASFVQSRSLHFVAHSGNLEAFNDIMTLGVADINETDQDGNTPLHLAAGEGHAEIVRRILDIQSTNINASNTDGWTPLHEACYDGRNEIVVLLLEANADINQTNQNGATPIYLACQEGHENLVQTLIQRQADVNISKHNGVTPAYVACQNNHHGVVIQLIEAGADLNLARQNGATPIYIACHNNHLDIVKLLLKARVNINARTDKGCTPVYVACQFGHVEIAKELIDAHANLNTPYQYGWTPLFIACQNGLTDIVQLLVEARVNVNATDLDGKTPLHIAAECNHYKICDILARNGGDGAMRSKEDMTAADLAKHQGSWESFFVLQGLPVSAATMGSLVGTRGKELADAMERDEAIASEMVEQVDSEPIVRGHLAKMVKVALQENKPFSEHILLTVWKFERSVHEESSLYNVLLDTCKKLLEPPVDIKAWAWFEEFLTNSAVWYQPHPLYDGQYMYQALREIVVDYADSEYRKCAGAVQEMINHDQESWDILTNQDEIVGDFKDDPRRQDDQLLSSDTQMGSKALMANTSESVLTEFSKGQFDAKRFYDTHFYLGQLVLNAHGVNDWVQADVNAIFQPMIEQGTAFFQRGPVKKLESCIAKMDRLDKSTQFPLTASITDVVRCSVTFNTPRDLIQGMHMIRDHIHNGQSPLKKVVLVENGYKKYQQGAGDSAEFACVTLNLVFDPEGWWIRPMLIEIQFLLLPFLELKLRFHQLKTLLGRDQLVDVVNKMRTDQQQLLDFLSAAATGDKKTVCRKLICGQDPNVTDANGNTAMHFAAQSDELEIVQLLLRAGGNSGLMNSNNKNASEVADEYGHDLVRYYISKYTSSRGRGLTLVTNRNILENQKSSDQSSKEIGTDGLPPQTKHSFSTSMSEMPDHRRKSSVLLHGVLPAGKEREIRRKSQIYKMTAEDDSTYEELKAFRDDVLADIQKLQEQEYATIFEESQFGLQFGDEDEMQQEPEPADVPVARNQTAKRKSVDYFDVTSLDMDAIKQNPKFMAYMQETNKKHQDVVERMKTDFEAEKEDLIESKVKLVGSVAEEMQQLRETIQKLATLQRRK